MDGINRKALRNASDRKLASWHRDLQRAMLTERPHDETKESWESTRMWVARLIDAIEDEQDSRTLSHMEHRHDQAS